METVSSAVVKDGSATMSILRRFCSSVVPFRASPPEGPGLRLGAVWRTYHHAGRRRRFPQQGQHAGPAHRLAPIPAGNHVASRRCWWIRREASPDVQQARRSVWYGFTAAPCPGWSWKWRCGAVPIAFPLVPTYPIASPGPTRCPDVMPDTYPSRCA